MAARSRPSLILILADGGGAGRRHHVPVTTRQVGDLRGVLVSLQHSCASDFLSANIRSILHNTRPYETSLG